MYEYHEFDRGQWERGKRYGMRVLDTYSWVMVVVLFASIIT